MPTRTGSTPDKKTIGMDVVAFFAAIAAGAPAETIAATLRLTKSVANQGSLS